MISVTCWSICVCQPVFVTGGFWFHSRACVYPYFDGRRVACHRTSAWELHLSVWCCMNKSLSHNPNLTSPQSAQWATPLVYGYIRAASVPSFLSMMDGDFCGPVNTQSEPHCPDLRYSSSRWHTQKHATLITLSINSTLPRWVCARARSVFARLCLLLRYYLTHSSTAVITQRLASASTCDRQNISL